MFPSWEVLQEENMCKPMRCRTYIIFELHIQDLYNMWKCNYEFPKEDIPFCVWGFSSFLMFSRLVWPWKPFLWRVLFDRILQNLSWEMLIWIIKWQNFCLGAISRNQSVEFPSSKHLAHPKSELVIPEPLVTSSLCYYPCNMRIFFKHQISWINTCFLHTYTLM